MRIVTDTNTVVSAFLWGGTPGRLLHAARAPSVRLFTSAVLIAELEEVLGRQKFAERLLRADSSVAKLLDGYLALATLIRPAPLQAVIPNDPDDDHVLACAVGAAANLIVSGDRDLLDLSTYQGIEIVSAQQAVQRLGV